jgi:hypothetical protein
MDFTTFMLHDYYICNHIQLDVSELWNKLIHCVALCFCVCCVTSFASLKSCELVVRSRRQQKHNLAV